MCIHWLVNWRFDIFVLYVWIINSEIIRLLDAIEAHLNCKSSLICF